MAIANASREDWKLLAYFFPPQWKELGQATAALKGLRQAANGAFTTVFNGPRCFAISAVTSATVASRLDIFGLVPARVEESHGKNAAIGVL